MILETIIGTVAGFIGTGITTYSNYKMRKLEIEDQQAQRGHQLDMLRAESGARIAEVQAQIEVTARAAEGALLLEEAKTYTETQAQGNRDAFNSAWMGLLLRRDDALRWLTVPLGLALCVLLGLSDAVKSFMRSGLTLFATAIATWVTWRAWLVLEGAGLGAGLGAVDAAQAVELWRSATDTVYFLAVTLISWWFGDRRVAKHLMHQAQMSGGQIPGGQMPGAHMSGGQVAGGQMHGTQMHGAQAFGPQGGTHSQPQARGAR